MSSKYDVVILGGGPTGLGAALHAELNGMDWVLLEASDRLGGLAASFKTEDGFSWDLGGHVAHSHYWAFDCLCAGAIEPNGWNVRTRDSRVWLQNVWVPYPLQHNLHRVPAKDRWNCIRDLVRTSLSDSPEPQDYDDWCLATFGRSFCDLFMRPYTQKCWRYGTSELGFEWVADRVPAPDLETVLKSVCLQEDYSNWGPNHTFRYPTEGGFGSLWEGAVRRLATDRLLLGHRACSIDSQERLVTTVEGLAVRYDALVSTIPLGELGRMLSVIPGELSELRHTAASYYGFGLAGLVPDRFRTASWLYFPEDQDPQYRVTVLSNYSHSVVPVEGPFYSLLAEVARYPQTSVVDQEKAILASLRRSGLVKDDTGVVSSWRHDVEYAYPAPFLGRDALIAPILRELRSDRSIYSRGRFGAWKYEVSNQDHCYSQGIEAVQHIASGEEEVTIAQPALVNCAEPFVHPFPVPWA